jgi:phage terminase large subunit-like protein
MRTKPHGPRTPISGPSRATDPATGHAEDLVAGRIVGGEIVRHAAERHLRDIKDGPLRGLHWRPERAAHALQFFPSVLTITEGAAVGQPFRLLPWQAFVVGSLFGWRRNSGRMRFRSGWLETGKGQGKSPLMAGLGLYMLGWYGVPRSKVFAIGQDRATANVLFKDAAALCRAPIPGPEDEHLRETLESRGDVVIRGEHDNAWKIEHPATGSVFQALANNEAVSGPRPTLVNVDEVHELKSDSAVEQWKRAGAKMHEDSLMLLGTNTPSTNQIVGTNYSEFYQKVACGEIRDDEAFAFIARCDVADRETIFDHEEHWPKSLPALNITFGVENVRGQVNTSRVLLSTRLSVARLFFGIPIGTTDFWIEEAAWAAVQGEVNPVAMRGWPCWLSLDLSRKNDLTGLTAIWADERGRLYAKTWYWTTKDGLADRSRADNAPYDQWVQQGFIAAVPGATIDKSFVAEQVKRLCAEHDVKFLAFDAAMISDFIEACEVVGYPVWKWEGVNAPIGRGLKLVSHAQGKRVVFEDKQLCMPRSIERLEDAILNGNITIDASPVTYSCAANAQIDSDGMNNRCFDKKRSRGRIDGIVTLAMAVGAATVVEAEDAGEAFSRMIVARGGLV